MSEEWGPWIEHDGRGFPEALRGVLMEIEAELYTGRIAREIGITNGRVMVGHWDWSNFGKSSGHGWAWARVIRYRIRKPRGLTILEGLLTDLPEKVDA